MKTQVLVQNGLLQAEPFKKASSRYSFSVFQFIKFNMKTVSITGRGIIKRTKSSLSKFSKHIRR